MFVKRLKPLYGGREVFKIHGISNRMDNGPHSHIVKKNFSGYNVKDTTYAGPNNRSVIVSIDEEDAAHMQAWGLPYRTWERDDGTVEYSVLLKLKLDKFRPQVVQILPSGETIDLDDDMISQLDNATIVDMQVGWTYGNVKGNLHAYINQLAVVIQPNLFSPDADDYYIEVE